MRLFEFQRITESFDDPYRYKSKWEEADLDPDDYDEEDGIPLGERVADIQKAMFTTDDGIEYMWYAKQNRYEPSAFEVAFGVVKGIDAHNGKTQLDITKTNTGNQMRVFATAIAILNDFVEYFEDDVQYISFTADKEQGESRSKLYKRLIQAHTPDGFKLMDVREDSNECFFQLKRTY